MSLILWSFSPDPFLLFFDGLKEERQEEQDTEED
jgi:hypothetical protein